LATSEYVPPVRDADARLVTRREQGCGGAGEAAVWNCWSGALAHLGVARANALQARTSHGADADAARVRALAAYKNFLTLWKDADSELPVLIAAKAEYAKLQ
jgi:hypothetical protein